MTDLKDGQHVRLTKGNTVIEGRVEWVSGVNGNFDIRIDGATGTNAMIKSDWDIEVIVPALDPKPGMIVRFDRHRNHPQFAIKMLMQYDPIAEEHRPWRAIASTFGLTAGRVTWDEESVNRELSNPVVLFEGWDTLDVTGEEA